jgi:hypothetical protein
MTALVALLLAVSASFPTHVPVSLTHVAGNICCPKDTRASVTAKGVLTQSTMKRGGVWMVVGRRHLTSAELRHLRADLATFNPASLKGNGAACNGAPIGDVGGYDLKVGRHESNCPPHTASANRLIKLLSGWLPKS